MKIARYINAHRFWKDSILQVVPATNCYCGFCGTAFRKEVPVYEVVLC